jgi:hypothetical protein
MDMLSKNFGIRTIYDVTPVKVYIGSVAAFYFFS